MKILIAEDDYTSRKMLAFGLQKQGHEIVQTEDGNQAWQKIQEQDAPRLLLLDIMMPEMDGLEICRKIRETFIWDSPYIILITAKTNREDIVCGLEAGANDYVTKPYDFEELRARINVGQRMLEMQASLLTEIDKHKSTKEQLQNTSHKLNKLVELNADGIMVVDNEGMILFINPAAALMLGRTENELLGNNFGFLLTTQENTEIELLSTEGKTRVVELRAQEMEWDGKSALLSSFRDVTDRKLAEQQLWEKEEERAAIYENSPLIILLVNREQNIQEANSFTSEFLNLSVKELEGTKLGQALGCPNYCHNPRGGGFDTGSAQCSVCNYVLNTFETGENYNQVEAQLSLTKQGQKQELTVLLSTRLLHHREKPLVLVLIVDITQRKVAEEKLVDMSFHDSLTGLYNRNFFEEEMERLADGRNNPMGIIVCDVDGLKFINDTLGHNSGDELIINTAKILINNFRTSDILARIGGDEFAILVPQTDQDTVKKLAQRLRQSIEEYNNNDPQIPLSLSVGCAVNEQNPTDMHTMFREADDRMYREKLQQKQSSRNTSIQALTKVMESRDFSTQNHSERLQNLVNLLAFASDLSEEYSHDLSLLARFHDLGKVGISDRILFKQDNLTQEELLKMKQHSEIGYRIAISVPDLEPIADWIYKHHEHWNGTGYPQGLKGEEIPLPCRILAIADAYDAMISDRPYRNAMTREQALQELQDYAGTQFDPDLVDKFINELQNR